MNEYNKRYRKEDGSELSIVSNQYSYGGKEGFFEAAWIIDGQVQEPLGWLTFAQVGEILAEHGWE